MDFVDLTQQRGAGVADVGSVGVLGHEVAGELFVLPVAVLELRGNHGVGGGGEEGGGSRGGEGEGAEKGHAGVGDGLGVGDEGAGLDDPVAHGHLAEGHALGLSQKGAAGEDLAEAGDEDGDKGHFDGLGDEGGQGGGSGRVEPLARGDAVAPARLEDGHDEPDAAHDGGVDGQDEDGDGEPVSPAGVDVLFRATVVWRLT